MAPESPRYLWEAVISQEIRLTAQLLSGICPSDDTKGLLDEFSI